MQNSNDLLKHALKHKYAIPQFNINNLEWTKYILEECNINKSPVILGVTESTIKYMGGYNVVANIVKSLIEDLNITIPVVLHLDHGTSVESCIKAINASFTSVMIDASNYELSKNIEITKKVVDYAHKYNVSVEAEIGNIGGTEDNINCKNNCATKQDSVSFIKNTNVDSLAPAIGNMHGIYKVKPNLNFKTIKEISEETNLPLVLHGSSNLTDEDIKKSIELSDKSQYYEEKARNAENNNAIYNDDPEAISKLKDKLERLENERNSIKAREHSTWELTNIGANIRETKLRIKRLEEQEQLVFPDTEFKGGKVIHNKEINRIQIIFDDIPNENIRSELKHNGFHWSRSEGAWQRQFNQRTIYVTNSLIKNILNNEKQSEETEEFE